MRALVAVTMFPYSKNSIIFIEYMAKKYYASKDILSFFPTLPCYVQIVDKRKSICNNFRDDSQTAPFKWFENSCSLFLCGRWHLLEYVPKKLLTLVVSQNEKKYENTKWVYLHVCNWHLEIVKLLRERIHTLFIWLQRAKVNRTTSVATTISHKKGKATSIQTIK